MSEDVQKTTEGAEANLKVCFYNVHFSSVCRVAFFVGTGILQNAESCQGVICGKSSAERSANYPLSLFRIPQSKNSAFPWITKLYKIVQQMCNRCIAASGVLGSFPSVFFVVRLPKNDSCCTISTKFEVSSAFQVLCHFAS